MWFGAVFADCAVFLPKWPGSFSSWIWQEPCCRNLKNMKTQNALLGSSHGRILVRGGFRLTQA